MLERILVLLLLGASAEGFVPSLGGSLPTIHPHQGGRLRLGRQGGDFASRGGGVDAGRRGATVTMESMEGRGFNGALDRRDVVRDLLVIGGAGLWLPQQAWGEPVKEECCKDGSASGFPNAPDTPYPPVAKGTKRLFLCRHGQTELNRLGKIQGARVDEPLNENGLKQAMLLGEAVRPYELAFIGSSKLSRARQTAEAIRLSHPGANGDALALLNEVDFGAVSDGLALEEARKITNKTYKRWTEGEVDARSPGGGESFVEVEARVKKALKVLLDSCRDAESTLAVTHSSYLRIALSIALGWDLTKSKAQRIDNCSVSVIDFSAGGQAQEVMINDVRHLRGIGVGVTNQFGGESDRERQLVLV